MDIDIVELLEIIAYVAPVIIGIAISVYQSIRAGEYGKALETMLKSGENKGQYYKRTVDVMSQIDGTKRTIDKTLKKLGYFERSNK